MGSGVEVMPELNTAPAEGPESLPPLRLVKEPLPESVELVLYDEVDGYAQVSLKIRDSQAVRKWLKDHGPKLARLDAIMRTEFGDEEAGDTFIVRGDKVFNVDGSAAEQYKMTAPYDLVSPHELPVYMEDGAAEILGALGKVTEIEVPLELIPSKDVDRFDPKQFTRGGQDAFVAADEVIDALPDHPVKTSEIIEPELDSQSAAAENTLQDRLNQLLIPAWAEDDTMVTILRNRIQTVHNPPEQYALLNELTSRVRTLVDNQEQPYTLVNEAYFQPSSKLRAGLNLAKRALRRLRF